MSGESPGTTVPRELLRNREITVVLAGNPNSGKTSIFNRLTGGHQHVGNYPGVTVEKKWGSLRGLEGPVRVVDLPGTYSLNALSEEEMVARRFLLEEKPDLVVDVVDTSNLERNIYLVVQLMELEVNLLVALNMVDVAQRSGQVIDLTRLSELLGAPVVQTVGHKGSGIEVLRQSLREVALSGGSIRRVEYGEGLEEEIAGVEALLGDLPDLLYPVRYAAVKLLEGDTEVRAAVEAVHPDFRALRSVLEESTQRLERRYKDSPAVLIADNRYGFAAGITREVTLRAPRVDRITQSERADAILTNRFLGMPLFLGFMFTLFWLTFTVGEPMMMAIDTLFGWIVGGIEAVWPVGRLGILRSLIIDGIIGGVGGVVVFLPNIVLLFMGISIFEDTGYMSRSAFIMDRLMHRFGLHGKSFIPMLIGFGCTIPAIMATRTLSSRKDRIITMLILPFVSCGARLPIYLLLIPAFFPRRWQAPVLWGIYLLGIMLGLVVARILSKTILKGEETPFVMELPPYRMPTLRSVSMQMWQRASMYLRKAGTIILAISILLWALMSFPKAPPIDPASASPAGVPVTEQALANAQAAADLEFSIAGRIGRGMQPFMAPMGFDWKISTSFLGAFAAKEVFVAQLGIIFALGEADENSTPLREKLKAAYSPAQGLAIIIFALLAAPCMATIAVTRRESGRWSYALLQWFGLGAVGYLLATLVYQIGSRIPG